MYIYDEANKLAKLLKESEEYRAYSSLKEKVYADENTKNLLKDYKKLQFEAQASYLSGKEPEEELMDKIKKLGEVLAFNTDVTEFLSNEYRLNVMLGDIYKIIGDAVDLSPDFLRD